MNTTQHIRVRFAPSPTGFMHLGNVRSALINYLFARQKSGVFILRIEDTDEQRNVDPAGMRIISDLEWLHLYYDEGPLKNGPYAPYYQSQRQAIYQEYLEKLISRSLVYRCFCTPEELEKKRQRQLLVKLPPRYDRACLALSPEKIQELLAHNTPFIWRFKLDDTQPVEFYDLAHKTMHFELTHFSDTPLTRQDGSFTFLFANFVDDVTMQITHVFRGEDHLTNTAVQVALYHAFNAPIPVFYHLPIIGNQYGKKLSKRDFGFSLTDLQQAGYLPEALTNYLAIIGVSFEQEIMSLEELAQVYNFENLSPTGQIRYDLEKLRWVNQQWIMRYNTEHLAHLCKPFLEAAYPQVSLLEQATLTQLIGFVQKELVTLKDSIEVLAFYFTIPEYSRELLDIYKFSTYRLFIHDLVKQLAQLVHEPERAATYIQEQCKKQSIPLKHVFTIFRIALTSKVHGPGLKDLLHMLGPDQARTRLERLLLY